MTEREALLRAVCEFPDDDTPRLVFADWLQEHGDEERAEFIRLQIEAARLAADDKRRSSLVARATELEEKHGAVWLSELPKVGRIDWLRAPGGWLGGEAFDRGFAARVRVDNAGAVVKHAKVLFAATPVRRLLIWNIKRADKLALLPHLRHLHTIRARIVSKQAADDLLKCPYLDAVPDIRLSFTALTEAHIERLRKKFGDRLQNQP
jgi:uncharacterized protein (TIGR02996 family)